MQRENHTTSNSNLHGVIVHIFWLLILLIHDLSIVTQSSSNTTPSSPSVSSTQSLSSHASVQSQCSYSIVFLRFRLLFTSPNTFIGRRGTLLIRSLEEHYLCLDCVFPEILLLEILVGRDSDLVLILTTMAAVTAAVSLPTSTSSSSLGRIALERGTPVSAERVSFSKAFLAGKVITSEAALSARVVPVNGRLSVKAQVTTEAPTKVEKKSRKAEEGVIVNKFKPKSPYIGRVLLNTKITGDDAPGETWHMVFSTEGEVPYREGQSIGIIPPGIDKNGKPHKLRLYSIASSALGDFGDSKTVSLCVKRLVYTNDQGEEVKGVCSNYLCDLKPGEEVTITGPIGKEMLMPADPNATIIMLATGTGIAPFRGFLWKMFFEKHDDYKFNGLAWLFLGVPTSSSLLYKEEFEKMKEKSPDKFRLDFAVSREQKNAKGEKMYIQTRMADYAKQLWELLKKDNTFVYMCGLKGMEKGIDDIMVSLAAEDGIDWIDFRKQLKRNEQWNVEVY